MLSHHYVKEVSLWRFGDTAEKEKSISSFDKFRAVLKELLLIFNMFYNFWATYEIKLVVQVFIIVYKVFNRNISISNSFL